MARWLFAITLLRILTGPVVHAAESTVCCPGDCNGDGRVTIDEAIEIVLIALEGEPFGGCRCFPECGDVQVLCNPVLIAVHNALDDCPQ